MAYWCTFSVDFAPKRELYVCHVAMVSRIRSIYEVGPGWISSTVEAIIVTGRKLNNFPKKRLLTNRKTIYDLNWVVFCYGDTCKHHSEITYVSYINHEFQVVNSLELISRYKNGFYSALLNGIAIVMPAVLVFCSSFVAGPKPAHVRSKTWSHGPRGSRQQQQQTGSVPDPALETLANVSLAGTGTKSGNKPRAGREGGSATRPAQLLKDVKAKEKNRERLVRLIM